MCSNPATPYMVGFSKADRKAFVFKADCDLWECKECATRKKNHWLVRGIRGSEIIRSSGTVPRFVTITSNGKLPNFAATAAVFPNAWGKLYLRLKRKTQGLKYLAITEGHKDGRLHLHMITNATMTKRWYKDNCAECGLGFMAECEEMKDNDHVAAYIVKYITKSLQGEKFPKKIRRVRASENWFKFEPDDEFCLEADWFTCYTTTSLWLTVEQCQREDRTMLNIRTGEYFDYGEAAETWYA